MDLDFTTAITVVISGADAAGLPGYSQWARAMSAAQISQPRLVPAVAIGTTPTRPRPADPALKPLLSALRRFHSAFLAGSLEFFIRIQRPSRDLQVRPTN